MIIINCKRIYWTQETRLLYGIVQFKKRTSFCSSTGSRRLDWGLAAAPPYEQARGRSDQRDRAKPAAYASVQRDVWACARVATRRW